MIILSMWFNTISRILLDAFLGRGPIVNRQDGGVAHDDDAKDTQGYVRYSLEAGTRYASEVQEGLGLRPSA